MWTYEQSTGILRDTNGNEYLGGYSGHGLGVNAPNYQNVPDIGPIPTGLYAMRNWRSDPEKGPLVCDLIPDGGNEMYGRSGFMMHGDLVTEMGLRLASLGCIVEPYATRLDVKASGDSTLQVIA